MERSRAIYLLQLELQNALELLTFVWKPVVFFLPSPSYHRPDCPASSSLCQGAPFQWLWQCNQDGILCYFLILAAVKPITTPWPHRLLNNSLSLLLEQGCMNGMAEQWLQVSRHGHRIRTLTEPFNWLSHLNQGDQNWMTTITRLVAAWLPIIAQG